MQRTIHSDAEAERLADSAPEENRIFSFSVRACTSPCASACSGLRTWALRATILIVSLN